MSLPSINFIHLTVSEIQPGQTFPRQPPAHRTARQPTRPTAHPDTMGENNTPTALKCCAVKIVFAKQKKQNIPMSINDFVEMTIFLCLIWFFFIYAKMQGFV